jgi:hypothetical protein
MKPCEFTCDIENHSDHEDMAIEIWIDDHLKYQDQIPKGIFKPQFSYEWNEGKARRLKIVMKGKTFDHGDAELHLHNIKFDGVDFDLLVYENAVYFHSYNSDKPYDEHRFYGHLGCNGEVVLEYKDPIYTWYYEKT